MRQFTTYTCDGVDYWFTSMPFGLKTAPAVLQRFMDHALARCKDLVFWYMYFWMLTVGRSLSAGPVRSGRPCCKQAPYARSPPYIPLRQPPIYSTSLDVGSLQHGFTTLYSGCTPARDTKCLNHLTVTP